MSYSVFMDTNPNRTSFVMRILFVLVIGLFFCEDNSALCSDSFASTGLAGRG